MLCSSGLCSSGRASAGACTLFSVSCEAIDALAACRSFNRRRLSARICFCSFSWIDLVYARCINSRFATKSSLLNGTSGLVRFLTSFASALLRIIFMPDLICCGEPDRSAAFCREFSVDAEETGSRGRELRRGGDVLGGGAEM